MKPIHSMLRIVTFLTLMGIGTICNAGNANSQTITVPAGTTVHVRMIDGISSDRNEAGQTFRASLDAPIVVHGQTLFPKGADAQVRLVRAESAGKVKGRSELALQLVHIRSNGRTYPIHSSIVEFRGSSQGKKTAKSAGIGGAIGAGVGALFGGGKGAAIGAGLGAGTGVATRAVEGGQQIDVGSESRVNFRLEAPVHVAR